MFRCGLEFSKAQKVHVTKLLVEMLLILAFQVVPSERAIRGECPLLYRVRLIPMGVSIGGTDPIAESLRGRLQERFCHPGRYVFVRERGVIIASNTSISTYRRGAIARPVSRLDMAVGASARVARP